jgi:hypothetical protein
LQDGDVVTQQEYCQQHISLFENTDTITPVASLLLGPSSSTACCNFLAACLPVLQLLEAYLLQGLPGPALAAKVLACFRDSISDAAMRLVRSMVLAKAAFSSPRESSAGGASSSISGSPSTRSSCSGLGDCTTEELCKLLSPDMVQPCLSKLLEVVFELLCSYRRMAQWHRAGIEQQQAAAAAAAAALKSHCEATSSSGGASSESAADPGSTGNPAAAVPSQAELDQVQAATSSMLEAVAGGLASSRMDIIEVAGARVCELLAVAKSCQGEDFIKVRSTFALLLERQHSSSKYAAYTMICVHLGRCCLVHVLRVAAVLPGAGGVPAVCVSC